MSEAATRNVKATPAGSTPAAAQADAFNELQDGAQVRPHYTKLFQTLDELGPRELKRRADTASRLVHEHGITYNIYGDPRGVERPWQVDPIPFMMSPEEWRKLEAGLIQRATLLNRILADCYGSQELIRSRWLSPSLVFAQPDFLRPCHNIRLPRDQFLHFYAADLARGPDGRWWVMSDRTQIPTGSGYALANRLVTSRIFPEPFRDNHVPRLAGFFRATQRRLEELSPRSGESPRVVVLTPGPHNETYFEQTFLARYLGYLLVEGQDLTVRDEQVYLKTLNGLERVDVILRRVDDDFCDPLELRNDSMLGVPGLVEALRAGNVAISNALGCGLLQSPAFLSFLPGLCKHILGEELKLPSVATWWCGQQEARKYALEHLGELMVKPACRTHVRLPDADKPLSSIDLEKLRQHIEFDPDLFVAQERVELSTAPTWNGEGFTQRPVSLRAFLVAQGDSYTVMPGGLTRVSPDPNGRFIAMQRGGSSKDTWVVSETPVEGISLLQAAGQNFELVRTGKNLPSRLADNFFWLGRYSERADATSRLLRCALQRFNPERTGSALPVLAPLLRTLELQGQLAGLEEKQELGQNPEAFEAELLAAIFDAAKPGSLHQIVDNLFRLAVQVRDRTSMDMWRVISELNDRLAMPAASAVLLSGDAVGVLNDTLLKLAAFHGLARENMTRAQAWRFIDMGLRIERAIYLGTLLNATLCRPEPQDPSVLEAVLEVADSSITYRSRYNLLPHVAAVFDLVLLDDKNPRSVLFQIKQLKKHFGHLPAESGVVTGNSLLSDCIARLEQSDPRELASFKGDFATSKVAKVIQQTLADLPKLSDTIAVSYFAHSTISRTGRGNE